MEKPANDYTRKIAECVFDITTVVYSLLREHCKGDYPDSRMVFHKIYDWAVSFEEQEPGEEYMIEIEEYAIKKFYENYEELTGYGGTNDRIHAS